MSAGRSMRPRNRPISYAEDQHLMQPHLMRHHQSSPQPSHHTQYNHAQAYYNGRLIEKQFSHPAHNKLVFNANNPQSFQSNQSGNNANNSQPTGLTPKPPKQPQKPLAPNNRYSQRIWDRIKAERPNAKVWEISRQTNQMWRELSPDEKQPYIDEYEAAKIEYNEQMQAYHNSPAYQAYTQYLARARAQSEQDSATDGRFHGTDLDELYSIEPAADPMKPRQPIAQALETQDDELDLQELASKRFKRNHNLMSEVFDDRYVSSGWGQDESLASAQVQYNFDIAGVSDKYQGAGTVAGIPTLSQIDKLKKRVGSLQDVIKKEQESLKDYEEKCRVRDEKHKTRHAKLNEDWKKICDETPEETYNKWKVEHESKLAEIKKQQEIRKKAQKERESADTATTTTETTTTTTTAEVPVEVATDGGGQGGPAPAAAVEVPNVAIPVEVPVEVPAVEIPVDGEQPPATETTTTEEVTKPAEEVSKTEPAVEKAEVDETVPEKSNICENLDQAKPKVEAVEPTTSEVKNEDDMET